MDNLIASFQALSLLGKLFVIYVSGVFFNIIVGLSTYEIRYRRGDMSGATYAGFGCLFQAPLSWLAWVLALVAFTADLTSPSGRY